MAGYIAAAVVVLELVTSSLSLSHPTKTQTHTHSRVWKRENKKERVFFFFFLFFFFGWGLFFLSNKEAKQKRCFYLQNSTHSARAVCMYVYVDHHRLSCVCVVGARARVIPSVHILSRVRVRVTWWWGRGGCHYSWLQHPLSVVASLLSLPKPEFRSHFPFLVYSESEEKITVTLLLLPILQTFSSL